MSAKNTKKIKELPLKTIQSKVESTIIYKKYFNYIKALIKRPSFKERVSKLREKYDIPPEGKGAESRKKSKGYIIGTPDLDTLSLIKDVEILAKEYELGDMWSNLVAHYVTFNKLDFKLPYSLTLEIADIKYCTNGPYKTNEEKEFLLNYLPSISTTHPLAILITPYASQKEIIDYVKKLDKPIKNLQKKYADPFSRLGKERSKSENVRERNEFIIANRKIPIKKLVSMVNDKFKINIDYSYVQRIIREWKRSELR